MEAQSRIGENTCIGQAARLVMANSGAAERLLLAHRPTTSGHCAGCGQALIRWPCPLVTIARAAQDLLAAEGPNPRR